MSRAGGTLTCMVANAGTSSNKANSLGARDSGYPTAELGENSLQQTREVQGITRAYVISQVRVLMHFIGS